MVTLKGVLRTNHIPPSEGALFRLPKTALSMVIAPWHDGYSIHSQSKSFLVKYIRKWWKPIVISHVRELNRVRRRDDQFKCVFTHRIENDEEIVLSIQLRIVW